MEHGIDILGESTVKRLRVLDRPFDKADGIFLQIRQPGVRSMQRNHLPAGLGQVLDEVETDKARAARDEGGFVSHGLRPLNYIGFSKPRTGSSMSQRTEHYRGYNIDGNTQGRGWSVEVHPNTPDLPILRRAILRILPHCSGPLPAGS
jgi:hypothetical protein